MAALPLIFAAGLFDSPWVVVVIVLISAIANWLSKRREQKQSDIPEGGEPSPSSTKPQGKFDLEETLRRWIGEESPAKTPPPPPLTSTARGELPPVSIPARRERKPIQTTQRNIPPLRPPMISVAHAGVTATATAVAEKRERAARRFEQLNEQGRHPATAFHGRKDRSSAHKRSAAPWRDPQSARRAFVASLIFAPPKGLES